MKLRKYDTDNIRVRSGGGGHGFPGGRGGGIGIGTLILAAVAYFVFGADPMQTIGTIQGAQQGGAAPADQSGASEDQVCSQGPYAMEACNALQSLNETWAPEFQRAGLAFKDPILTLYSGVVNTQGCGSASSAAGPFYCPADQGIYIDTSFYDQLAQMAGERGDFARLYVIAHEYGHHIQNLTGLADQVRSAQQQNPRSANELQVRMELQADCYAGVWAGKNRRLIEPGDLEEGMRAASSIGDDTLQRKAGQRINPEGFTHGTSQQRMDALRSGLESGNDAVCDRYFR